MALYENQIKAVLSTDVITRDIFLGVFARDEIPQKLIYPSCFVVNTDKRNKNGAHWLAFYFTKNKFCYFFDSFGNDPNFFNLNQYLFKHSSGWTFNNKRLQGFSEYCGYYCILFLLYKVRNNTSEFYKIFKNNSSKNDKKILQIIKQFY